MVGDAPVFRGDMKSGSDCAKGRENRAAIDALKEDVAEQADSLRSNGTRWGEQDKWNLRMELGGAQVTAEELSRTVADAVADRIEKTVPLTNGDGLQVTWKQVALALLLVALASSLGPQGLAAIIDVVK